MLIKFITMAKYYQMTKSNNPWKKTKAVSFELDYCKITGSGVVKIMVWSRSTVAVHIVNFSDFLPHRLTPTSPVVKISHLADSSNPNSMLWQHSSTISSCLVEAFPEHLFPLFTWHFRSPIKYFYLIIYCETLCGSVIPRRKQTFENTSVEASWPFISVISDEPWGALLMSTGLVSGLKLTYIS